MKKDIFNENLETFTPNVIHGYVTLPKLPDVLKPLEDIANNMWWCWNSDAVELFRRLERDIWEETYHNPKGMLGLVPQERFEDLADDNSFILHMERVKSDLDKYMSMPTWYLENFGEAETKERTFAYFSTEFAIHESLPIYSGGLGILSGDHLKSASDLGLPLVGVGLLYRYGYFRQFLNFEGWQQEEYIENHFVNMPLELVRDADGNPVTIEMEYDKTKIHVRAWKLQVGRIPLYLMDTDFEGNVPKAREITGHLYGGDRDMRIRQEIILGIAGKRFLEKININPSVIHINEGHSAFLIFENMRSLMVDNGLTFEEASLVVRNRCAFTTHTPVPAGNEMFSHELMLKYFSENTSKLGISKEQLLSLGSFNPVDTIGKDNFSMTIFALKTSNKANGVSRLHATVSRDMWNNIWPELPKKEVPITHITNGIHTNTWLSFEFSELFDRYLGAAWKDEPADHTIWQHVANIPDAELWRSHERRRERLVSFARQRLVAQLERRGVSQKAAVYAEEVLDPEALTIGFARRFATYKRGNLIFKDFERIKKILTSKERPVQILIAGKAHPNDDLGKSIIKEIVNLSSDPDLKRKVIFLEEYDMNVAHYLVQGVDVWLNNPLRPEEASGTSGMKAAVNGILNFSVLDGWWCEGYNGTNGWTIGGIDAYPDREYQDEVESKAIYETLENEIIPLFYERGVDGLPREWIKKMKNSMITLGPVFNTNRMLEEYTRKFYVPTSASYEKIVKDNFKEAKNKTAWQENLKRNWSKIKVEKTEDNITEELSIEKNISVKATLTLPKGISADDVAVQIFLGHLSPKNVMSDMSSIDMKLVSKENDTTYVYEGTIQPRIVGPCGYTIRVLPQYMGEVQLIPGLLTWQN
jgi:starch phosphorylase